MDFFPGWWNELRGEERPWWSIYANLDLGGGSLIVISDDSEDMLEVKYLNGMLIDVGYIEGENNKFFYEITVIRDDTVESWNDPITQVKIQDKNMLAEKLQSVIYQIQDYTK